MSTTHRSIRLLAGIVAFTLSVTGPLTAQGVARDSVLIPDRQLFHRSDLYVAGAFVLGTVVLLPADRHLTSLFRDEDLVNNGGVKRAANAGSFLGGSGPFVIGSTMYVVGRLGRMPRMAELRTPLRVAGHEPP